MSQGQEQLISGRCHCKKAGYKIDGAKRFEFFCHCLDCRKLNGGGHLAAIVFDRNSFTVEGVTKVYTYPGGSGKSIQFNFCPECGTPLFAYLEAHPEIVTVRANSLDTEGIYTPKKSLFAKTAFAWDLLLQSAAQRKKN